MISKGYGFKVDSYPGEIGKRLHKMGSELPLKWKKFIRSATAKINGKMSETCGSARPASPREPSDQERARFVRNPADGMTGDDRQCRLDSRLHGNDMDGSTGLLTTVCGPEAHKGRGRTSGSFRTS